MNSLERFKETVYFGKPDRAFLWPQWIFEETLKRWKKEGMPVDVHLNTYFGFDRVEIAPINLDLIPPVQVEVIEEDKETAIYMDELGNKWKRWKYREIGMSQWIEFGLKDWKTWEKYKERLNPFSPLRYPEYWDDWKRCVKNRAYSLYCWMLGILFEFYGCGENKKTLEIFGCKVWCLSCCMMSWWRNSNAILLSKNKEKESRFLKKKWTAVRKTRIS